MNYKSLTYQWLWQLNVEWTLYSTEHRTTSKYHTVQVPKSNLGLSLDTKIYLNFNSIEIIKKLKKIINLINGTEWHHQTCDQ